ncbi:MAG: T9SS type A sorting domain-containing protein [Bacteroidetes bacterium]|nr:T9SS type A sorting domain-containing protein [Bacteroidota bacterium]HET6244360.1 T9SS type A sorting domain-containing protein [Bacteroidia bacterium]
MENNKENSRRNFLRNSTLATLSATLFPGIVLSKPDFRPYKPLNCNPSTLDYYGQGPFYLNNAPVLTDGQLASATEAGTRLVISGVVRTLDCSQTIANAKIDIWQANDSGQYYNSSFDLRGVVYSNAQGFYLFETILPGKYLNGAKYRPRHIHFKITPSGHPTLTTQLYFQGDSDISEDAAASLSSGTYDATHRIIPITLNGNGKYEGTWDIVVDGSGSTGMGNPHLEKGMIYRVSPNPFYDSIEIEYGVFLPARVEVKIFNMSGNLIKDFNEGKLQPQKSKLRWEGGKDLPAGIYWVSLKINDMQVHYQKIVKS